MSRMEIAGWLQLIVACIGLYITVNSGGAAFDALAQMAGGGSEDLPAEFAGSQGVLRVFLFLLIVIICTSVALIGLGIVLGAVFRHMGAKNPITASNTFVVFTVMLTATLTMAIYGHPVGILTGLAAALLIGLTGIAACFEDPGDFWGLAILGSIGARMVGIFAMIVVYAGRGTPPSDPSLDTDSSQPPVSSSN